MKTYLLDILNKYNRFSENLDVKTILCNKSWLVFNDTGNKELYIFQENGNLIASVNGNVHNGNWQYISANKSIILSIKEQNYMLLPSFFDKTIFALQQDGTNKYAFMIDEKQSQSFQPKSLTELNSYFENIERKRIEEEQRRIRLQVEQERANEQRKIEEKHRKQIKRQKERVQQYQNQKRLEYWEQNQNYILQNDLSYKKLCSSKKKWEIIETIFVILTIIGFYLINIDFFSLGIILMPIFGSLSLMNLLINYPYIDIKEYKEKIKQNILNGDFETRMSKKNKRVERRKQERESWRKQEIEYNKRKIEERKKKEKEWEVYKSQREQNDIDRIEQHRIEREKREKEERILREQENIKKDKEKKEQELKEREERKKWLKEEAFNIQCKLNSNKNAKELAKQISLDIQYLNTQYDKDLIFKVNWICPNHTYKEVSLIINNGNDTLLYEHLAILGNQIIELKEVKSVIRVTLRLIWLDIPVYKIILI